MGGAFSNDFNYSLETHCSHINRFLSFVIIEIPTAATINRITPPTTPTKVDGKSFELKEPV